MKDKNYRLSAELCALKAEDADKLIAAGDGDAALLYIYLLRRGQAPDAQLRRELGWEPGRLAAAVGRLAAAGLLTGSDAPPAAPAEVLPEYTAQELVRRSGEDPAFRSILAEAESLLGRTLSGADTRALFGVYDYLGLPVDVIMELLHHCAEECRLKYGPGRVPTMKQIEKEAYVWANREILTFEQAEEYIRARAKLRDATDSLRRAFGIHDRPLSPTERKYIEGWLEQGFTQEALELAYDKTVTNTGQQFAVVAHAFFAPFSPCGPCRRSSSSSRARRRGPAPRPARGPGASACLPARSPPGCAGPSRASSG